jgi:hypothetical protein
MRSFTSKLTLQFPQTAKSGNASTDDGNSPTASWAHVLSPLEKKICEFTPGLSEGELRSPPVEYVPQERRTELAVKAESSIVIS